MATKVTVNLPDETVDTIKRIANARGITVTEALRQAIETDAFFRDQVKQGNDIVLERPEGTKRQVVLR